MLVDVPTPTTEETGAVDAFRSPRAEDLLAEAVQVLREAKAHAEAVYQTAEPEAVGHLLRAVHSYKSLMAFGGRQRESCFADEFERYLRAIWQGRITIDKEAQSLIRQGLSVLQEHHREGDADPSCSAAELVERFTARVREAVSSAPPPEPVVPPTARPQPDRTAEGRPALTAQLSPSELAELAQLGATLNRLLHRQREILPPDDERLDALLSALLVTGERLSQTLHRHRFVSLRAFLLPAVGAVREMAASQGKQACARLEVTNSEVDRPLLQALRPSVLHLLRNSVAHGIETPAERAEAGKPEMGTITVSGAVEDGWLRLSVKDDGKGFDIDALRCAAVASGAVSPERAAATPDEQAMDYALIPGLSTRDQPDALSGNGVGLTVVAEDVRALGGEFRLDSRPGEYSMVNLAVPLPSAACSATA